MNTYKAQKRNMKLKAKRLRREGFVTGNLFGRQIDGSIPLQFTRKEAERLQSECLKGSQLNLEVDGRTYDVLLKDVLKNNLNHQLMELDFQALVAGEVVHNIAEIRLHNVEKVMTGVVEQMLETISYRALPENMIDTVDVDCGKLKLGDVITIGDLAIAKDDKITILTHLDTPVVNVIASRNIAAEAAEPEE